MNPRTQPVPRVLLALCGALLMGCAGSRGPDELAPVDERGATASRTAVTSAPARPRHNPTRQRTDSTATDTAGAGIRLTPLTDVEPARVRDVSSPPSRDRAQLGQGVQLPPVPPAVITLLNQANRDLRAGRADSAAVDIERAINIQPSDPWLWHRLADIRRRQGRYDQAIGLAEKSNALASDSPRLRGENWRLIAQARQRIGDVSGARLARTKADRLEASR